MDIFWSIFMFLCFLIFRANAADSQEPEIKIKEVKPDYKVVKYTFTRDDNDTDVMSPEPAQFEIIPLDFLCEFCQVVILKLKQRQATEPDFEEKIKKECINGTSATDEKDSSLCDVINRVNLETLKNDGTKEICEKQNMCNGTHKQKSQMPGTAPQPDSTAMAVELPVEIDNKNVNATLLVDDIAPSYS